MEDKTIPTMPLFAVRIAVLTHGPRTFLRQPLTSMEADQPGLDSTYTYKQVSSYNGDSGSKSSTDLDVHSRHYFIAPPLYDGIRGLLGSATPGSNQNRRTNAPPNAWAYSHENLRESLDPARESEP